MMKKTEIKRKEIIDASFELMLSKGYEGTSIQDITDRINATKGLIYHYFGSKKDVAAAVIEEAIKPAYNEFWSHTWNELYGGGGNPLENIIAVIDKLYEKKGGEFSKTGCPLGNLILELSTKDIYLSRLTDEILIVWHTHIEKALLKAKEKRIIAKDADLINIGNFIIAGVEGCVMLSKSKHNKEVLKGCFDILKNYIRSLQV
ncbi:MAG: TetR/AcrR family transcriptional regulator [Deltaproteobacteria bacterium]|nr:TetR/AcrR family transcriptional regulator [Deltaproteobacteria bacterium]